MHLPKILSLTVLSTLLSITVFASLTSPASPDPALTFPASTPLGFVLATFYTEKDTASNTAYELKGSYNECCPIQFPNNANTEIKSVTLGGQTKGCKLYKEAGCKGEGSQEVKDVTKTDDDVKLGTILSVICELKVN